MERTWSPKDGIKRGDYSLSQQRKRETVESYRTMDPSLQEQPRFIKVRVN